MITQVVAQYYGFKFQGRKYLKKFFNFSSDPDSGWLKPFLSFANGFAGMLEFIGEFNPYNGVTSEICMVFFAYHLQITIAKPDETEEFEVVHCTPEEMEAMIREKKIWDGMTLAAWMLSRHNVLKRIKS